MQHFIDRENLSTVYSFEDDCDPTFIPENLEKITGSEAREILKSLAPKAGLEVFKDEIQSYLDSEAMAAGYDDIRSAVTYADEPSVPKFQAEGMAFRSWRSKVWDYGLSQLELVKSGERKVPSIEIFIEELPKYESPLK